MGITTRLPEVVPGGEKPPIFRHGQRGHLNALDEMATCRGVVRQRPNLDTTLPARRGNPLPFGVEDHISRLIGRHSQNRGHAPRDRPKRHATQVFDGQPPPRRVEDCAHRRCCRPTAKRDRFSVGRTRHVPHAQALQRDRRDKPAARRVEGHVGQVVFPLEWWPGEPTQHAGA